MVSSSEGLSDSPIPLEKAEYVVYDSREVQDWQVLAANIPGLYITVSAIEVCNLDYYPDWAGDPRLLAVKKPLAYTLGVVK